MSGMSGEQVEQAETDDDRALRRDVTCIVTGLLAGAVVGMLVNLLGMPGGVLLPAIAAAIGGAVGGLVALHIDVEEWDPSFSHRSYVGARSPDDNFASPS
jgi:uncharacterized membrane protein